ncbi:MAG: DUF4332 domain-containing protein [Armatimonadota bacterium]
MANVREIEGIGDAAGAKLEAAGVKTEEQLLTMGATEKGREELAEKTGLSSTNIYKWVKMADMNRINGIGSQTSEVLFACGVDSVKELAQRNAENLHATMVEVNDKKNLSNHLPSVGQMQKFIDEAKTLPRVIVT